MIMFSSYHAKADSLAAIDITSVKSDRHLARANGRVGGGGRKLDRAPEAMSLTSRQQLHHRSSVKRHSRLQHFGLWNNRETRASSSTTKPQTRLTESRQTRINHET